MADYHPGILHHRFHRVYHRAVQAELAAAGLEEVGHPLLLALLKSYHHEEQHDCPHANASPVPNVRGQSGLADCLHVSPAAVAASLKSLERGGFIRRERLEQDARRNRIFLTEKGRQAVAVCQTCFQRIDERMLTGFSQQERRQLEELWLRMLENLREQPDAPSRERRNEDCSSFL